MRSTLLALTLALASTPALAAPFTLTDGTFDIDASRTMQPISLTGDNGFAFSGSLYTGGLTKPTVMYCPQPTPSHCQPGDPIGAMFNGSPENLVVYGTPFQLGDADYPINPHDPLVWFNSVSIQLRGSTIFPNAPAGQPATVTMPFTYAIAFSGRDDEGVFTSGNASGIGRLTIDYAPSLYPISVYESDQWRVAYQDAWTFSHAVYDFTAAPVSMPEPGSLMLIATGLLALYRRRASPL